MWPAVMTPGPVCSSMHSEGSRLNERSRTRLTLSRNSTMSSRMNSSVLNSCKAPSIRAVAMAAPGSDDSRVRRSGVPSVCAKPGRSGSM